MVLASVSQAVSEKQNDDDAVVAPPSNLRPRRRTPPATVLQSGTRHQSPGQAHSTPASSNLTSGQPSQPAPGPRQLTARSGPLGPQGHQVTDQAYPSPLLQAHQTPAPSNPTSGQPVLPQPGHRPARLTPALCSKPTSTPANPSQAYPPARLTRPSSRLFTNTDISSVAYKTPCNFYREGTILPVFALPVNTNIPGTHWGGTGDIS